MCNCSISFPSDNLTMLAKAFANWLCARGKCDVLKF